MFTRAHHIRLYVIRNTAIFTSWAMQLIARFSKQSKRAV